MRIVATPLTGGSATYLPEFKPYVYAGDRPLATDALSKAPPGSGADVKMAARRARLELFAAILKELGEPDPVKAPNPACVEAGKRVGVGQKTALSYRTAIKQQRERAAAGHVDIGDEDEPSVIVAKLHKQIAAFSPGHASLVAEYEASRRATIPLAAAGDLQ